MLKFVVVLALVGVTVSLPANKSVQSLETRIVGGEDTIIEHYPWQLALLYFLRHFCGATLIRPQVAITSARCLEGAVVTNLAVRAGSTTRSSGGQIVDVRQFHIHPNYNVRTVDYDFAILRLAEPVSVQTAAHVKLPEPNSSIFEGEEAVLTGWGLLSPGGKESEILQVAFVPVVSQERCQTAYAGNTITSRMFCTGRLGVGGVDACQGDGGGPVLVGGHLAGIVSWGSGCASPDYPGVHANVATVIDWVYDAIDM